MSDNAIDNKYGDIYHAFAIECAGIGAASMGSPIDLPLVTGSWVLMILAIADKAGCDDIDNDSISKFVSSVLIGAGAYLGGTKVFNMLLHVFPGFGSVGAASLNAALNWIYTVRMGYQVAKHFDNPNFSRSQLTSFAVELPSIIFCLPTLPEIQEALREIN